MQYIKDHYTIDWDKVHAAHNQRVQELRSAFKLVVMDDMTTGRY